VKYEREMVTSELIAYEDESNENMTEVIQRNEMCELS